MTAMRNFTDSDRQAVVEENYAKNHREMTVALVHDKQEVWGGLSHGEHTIKEVLDMLDSFVDNSDPDVDVGNSIHAFQTAERIRKDYPDEDWMHLTGLIHDLGKVMAVWGEPQHLVVGDTFVVGCEHPREVVFPDLFEGNPDTRNLAYKGKYGMYEHGCGLDELLMAWGHDEYMYRVLEGK